MSSHEMVHRFVPRAPVVLEVRAIPPVFIKVAVSKTKKFRERVEKGLKESEETGEPDNEGYRRQFHNAFKDRGYIPTGYLVQRIAEHWYCVLCRSKPNENRKANDFEKALQDKHPTDMGGTRINGLVDQGWRPPEVCQIAN